MLPGVGKESHQEVRSLDEVGAGLDDIPAGCKVAAVAGSPAAVGMVSLSPSSA